MYGSAPIENIEMRIIFKLFWIFPLVGFMILSCEDADDFNNTIDQITCSDGLQNGDELGVDCGGSCIDCIDGLDFSGFYVQQDVAGRPAVNTVFNLNPALRDAFNVSLVSSRGPQDLIIGYDNLTFPLVFNQNIEGYFAGYTINEEPVSFNGNVLGFNSFSFATFMAQTDALQLAEEGPTSYYNGDTWFTGRNLTDDIMDTTLLLLFGGPQGERFDGVNGPLLISDGIGIGDRIFSTEFPYLEPPIVE